MKLALILISYAIFVIGYPHQDLNLQARGLIPRQPASNPSGRSSRGATPERRKESPPRAKSAPPRRSPRYPKLARADAFVSGAGRISTVAEGGAGAAALNSKHYESGGSMKIDGSVASVTGISFDNRGHVITSASGCGKVTSSITTRPGGSACIKAQAPGQAAVNVNIKGDSKAEVQLSNPRPDLGHATIDSRIWGKGMSFTTGHNVRRRQLESLELLSE